METKLDINGRRHALTTAARTLPGPLRFEIDGVEREVEVVEVSEAEVLLRVGDALRRVAFAEGPSGSWASVDGRSRLVREAGRGRRGPAGLDEEPGAVTPPFPATVAKVLVAPGDRVEKGQALVVVTAMKTEMTLAAPRPGRVSKVSAEVGASVGPGDVLVEIEEESEGADG